MVTKSDAHDDFWASAKRAAAQTSSADGLSKWSSAEEIRKVSVGPNDIIEILWFLASPHHIEIQCSVLISRHCMIEPESQWFVRSFAVSQGLQYLVLLNDECCLKSISKDFRSSGWLWQPWEGTSRSELRTLRVALALAAERPGERCCCIQRGILRWPSKTFSKSTEV